MTFVTASDFAVALGITDRAARKAFAKAHLGKAWNGETLPVVQIPTQRGGKGGAVWALRRDGCSEALLAKLGAVLPSIEGPVNEPFSTLFQQWQFEERSDRLQIIRPILGTKKGTAERTAAFQAIAAKHHLIKGGTGLREGGHLARMGAAA